MESFKCYSCKIEGEEETFLKNGFNTLTPKGWNSLKPVFETIDGELDEDGLLIISEEKAKELISKYPESTNKRFYLGHADKAMALKAWCEYISDPYCTR